jgi:hypothetical protein
MRGPDEGVPSLARLGAVLSRLAGNGRDANEVMATGALNFAPGELLIALQVLLAFGAGEFKLVHSSRSSWAGS